MSHSDGVHTLGVHPTNPEVACKLQQTGLAQIQHDATSVLRRAQEGIVGIGLMPGIGASLVDALVCVRQFKEA